MGYKHQAVQWTKYLVGGFAMFVAALLITDVVSGGGEWGSFGFVMILVFIVAAKAWFNYLGLDR